MKRGFDPVPAMEPDPQRLQWGPALGAGLIAGAVLLLVPRGSPWSTLTFFSRIVMGREFPFSQSLPLVILWAIQLGVGVVYGVLVSILVASFRQKRAILLGGVAGFGLYWLNYGLVSLWWSDWRGSEAGVAFTHIVFGLLAGGAYRGLLRRHPVPAETPPA